MGLGETLSQWLEGRAAVYKANIAHWLVEVGIDHARKQAADIEPDFIDLVKEMLEQLKNTDGLPPIYKAFLTSIGIPKNPAVLIALVSFMGSMVASLANTVTKQAMEPVLQQLNRITPWHVPGLPEVIDMKLRGKMTQPEYELYVGMAGWSKEWADRFYDMKTPILPSNIAFDLSHRDPVKYAHFVQDLPKLGLSTEQIEALYALSFHVPGVQDIIRYVVKEAYDPATVAEFGQASEYPSVAEADARIAGVLPDQLMKEWIAHWDLPGVSQGYEMMHRGEITEPQLDRLLKARDIMPFWRSPLKAISWQLPGRIELRMMALYNLIDKGDLIQALAHDGLAEQWREPVAQMNLVRGIKTDIQTRYTNGWINADAVLAELTSAGLTGTIRDKVYQSIVKNAQAARTATQKSLTLAQIEKGVKRGKLTRAEASTLLVDIGYDLQEATFLLDVDVPLDSTDAVASNRELSKADILAGLKSDAIKLPEARTRLIALRYLPADADYILRVYQLSIKPPADPVERDISKADITQAVKLGLVTPTQGYELLRRIGFSDDAATFILSIVAESSPFSPYNFEEFRALTGSWRRSQGLTDEVLPPAALELRLQQAQAVAEGRSPVLETLRIQIDTIRRQRRSGALTREAEIAALTKLQVPPDYLAAIVANDDARIAARK